MQTPKKKVNYVNNKALYEALVEYKANPTTRVHNLIGQAIIQICTKLGTRGNFAGYTYRDEMVDDAIESCVYAIPHFNTEKYKNPFGYFSRVAWRAMVTRIGKEKKETYIKHKNFQSSFDSFGSSPNELSNQVIEQFEKKLAENKKKSKKGLLTLVEDDKVDAPKLSRVGLKNT